MKQTLENNALDADFDKSEDGLLPAIVQDAKSRKVLMLGYMNREACMQTIESGLVTFYSRSRKQLWTKGETSGNYLRLCDIALDCDSDAFLLTVEPKGPTCHTGAETCFTSSAFKADPAVENPLHDTSAAAFTLSTLQDIITSRRNAPLEGSYTASLFERGLARIAQKIGEEATEVVIAALGECKEEFNNEAADLLFHFMVLLAAKDCSLEDILEVLRQRNSQRNDGRQSLS